MHNDPANSHFDVIISGCGPVGGVMANLLSTLGLSVCVLERFVEVYPQPRAIVLDWEIMRALQFCGVAHSLAPATRPHPGTDFIGMEGQLIKLFDPTPPPFLLGWPATLTFIQPDLERMLRRALSLRETACMRVGVNVTTFRDLGDKVEVAFVDAEQPGAETIVTGDFLIGCDGGNSPVRAALGVGLVDLEFDEWWVVVDAWQLCDTELPLKTTQYCWPSRPATYVVGPGNLRRWELKMLPDESPEDFADSEVLKSAMAPFVDTRCFDIWRHAAYRFAARTGESWRRNRVFLAGDAVHQMPPFLGQGLCAGIRDAFNLAWKLAWVKRYGWNEALLASYEAERRPHVEKIVSAAKEFGLIIGEMDPQAARVRDETLRAQLLDGTMVTSRQKIIPSLAGGLVTDRPLSGELMPQPLIRDGARVRLMDDILPLGFLFVSRSDEQQVWMDDNEAIWADLGGTRIALMGRNDVKAAVTHAKFKRLYLADDVFDDWAETYGIKAIVVRPDRYIHAAIANADELAECLGELHAVLRA